MASKSMARSLLLANVGVVVVSLAISFCGMTLGLLVAETAYALVYGNEGDAEFSALVFKGLVGLALFLGMPVVFYIVRTTELTLRLELSRLAKYGSTIGVLVTVILLLAGSRFDYQWVIFLMTTAVVWLIYCESIDWLWVAPRRMVAATATAVIAVGLAVVIPRVLHRLDVQPDWLRHASAAAMLLIALTMALAAVIAIDRHKRRDLVW
jgi:hypothetical protein